VGAGAGEHLADLGAAEGADDDLAAAAGLGAPLVLPGELADHLHGAEAHDDGLRGFEALVDGAVLGLELGDIFLELREWVDWHVAASCFARTPAPGRGGSRLARVDAGRRVSFG